MNQTEQQIVEWLRERADDVERIANHRETENRDYWRGQTFAYQKVADAIETGSYREKRDVEGTD